MSVSGGLINGDELHAELLSALGHLMQHASAVRNGAFHLATMQLPRVSSARFAAASRLLR
jgi:hypothetical protein